ncbi:hypothetical protein BSKO_09355 [Bryopsis sp. KO-2023]|nr:hypothetical protein BSKO_09355 [Bryopsis sp. KO-2023]
MSAPILGLWTVWTVFLSAAVVCGFFESEVSHLLALKNGINPQQILSSWDADDASRVCRRWTGIVCDTEGHVVKVVLQNLLVFGTINTTALEGLPKLVELHLSGNQFVGPFPDLSGLEELSVLNLGSNLLTGTLPLQNGQAWSEIPWRNLEQM